MSETTLTGVRVISTKHVATSASGNPTYRVWFSDGSEHLTETDASVGYSIDNREYRENACTVWINSRGRVVRIRVES